ncbi:hypothetical protein AGMMS50225_11950 [Betaproteobacteria bacterium]|nr:hypothetical protein AGMMS50225_11950 [Betaproteobacteria bacterium]
MSTSLALSIKIGAAAGAALSVFGNLKGTMQRVADVTSTLKAKQKALGKEIEAAARLPITNLHTLREQFERQGRTLDMLRAKTKQLGITQSAIAANEANRSLLRSKMMETAGLAYVASRPFKVGIEFEASMSRVQALTRLDKDSDEMKALTGQARALGAATSFTASEAAQAQGFLAMAGFKTADILASMPPMLDLAKAGGMDLQRTADIASNIQTAYGIDASQMTRVADVLTAAFTNANVDLEMLSQTMKYMGPVAKQFGMSLEESAAMAGLLGNAGIQGDMAGTALRGVMSKLAGPTTKQAKILKELGIKTKDAAGNMRALPEILLDLAKATDKMGSGDKVATIMGLFDQRAGPAVLAMMDQKDKLQAAIDTVNNSAGAASKTAAIMNDNTAGALLRMKSAWEDLSISMANTGNGALRDLIEFFAIFLQKVSAWVQKNPETVKAIMTLIVGFIAFKVALLGLAYTASLIASPFLHLWKIGRMIGATRLLLQTGGLVAAFPKIASAIGWIGKLKTSIGKAAIWLIAKGAAFGGFFLKSVLPSLLAFGRGLLQAFIGPIGIVVKAFLWMARALLMTPIGLIITAIAVAAFLIYKYWGPIKAFFLNLWDDICGGAKAVWDDASSFVVRKWDDMCGGARALWSDLSGFFVGLWTQIQTAIGGGLTSIAALILNWSPLGLFYQAFAGVMSWFGIELPGTFTAFGSMIIDGLINGITGKAVALRDSISMAIGDGIDAAKAKLGINSPSRVFAAIGGFTMQGMTEGIAANMRGPLDAIKGFSAQLAAAGAVALTPALAIGSMAPPPGSAAPLPALTRAAPAGGMAGSAASASMIGATTIQITVNPAPGMDEKALAELVARKIRETQLSAAAQARSRLTDAD